MREYRKSSDHPHLGEVFYDHFIRCFGEPIRRYTFIPDERINQTMQIAEFVDASRNCRTFCSFGLSRHRRVAIKPVELCLLAELDAMDAHQLLAAALTVIIHEGLRVKFGTAIPLPAASPKPITAANTAALYVSKSLKRIWPGFQTVVGQSAGWLYPLLAINADALARLKRIGPDSFDRQLRAFGNAALGSEMS